MGAACGIATEKRQDGFNDLLVFATIFDFILLSPWSIKGKVGRCLDKGVTLVSVESLLSI